MNYFINIDGEQIENNIKLILTKICENELLSPILVLEILKKKKNMKFETVKNFIVNSLMKEKKNIDSDKKEFETNYNKLEKINTELKELKQKCKTFQQSKCAFCNKTLEPPAVYFLCPHSYHLLCLNAEVKDDMKDVQCPHCLTSKIKIFYNIIYRKCTINSKNKTI